MSRHWGRGLQLTAAAFGLAGYAGLSHYCNTTPGAGAGIRDLGAALVIAPAAALAAVYVWRGTPRSVALLFTAGSTALLVAIWPLLARNYDLLALLEDTAIYGLLGLSFGRSLLPGQVAFCTRLADRLHGPLSPPELTYTRRVTAAWTFFFVAISATSIALYAWTPLRLWSIYTNFCVLPLVGGMFLAENLVRRLVLPRHRRPGLMATVRVYLATPE